MKYNPPLVKNKCKGTATIMKLIVLILFIIIATCCPICAQGAKTEGHHTISDTYEFPVRPGMPEWSRLDSYAAMVAICQIPEDLLSGMSTDALTKTCLRFPLAYNFMTYDNFERGIENVISDFNGLRELLKRKDAGVSLLETYKTLDPAILPDCGHVAKTVCRFQIMYVELLLSQNAIISDLSRADIITLLEQCQSKYYSKRDHSDGIMQIRTTCFLMSKILLNENYSVFQTKVSENQEIMSFLNGAPQNNEDVINEILDSVEEFLFASRKEGINEAR